MVRIYDWRWWDVGVGVGGGLFCRGRRYASEIISGVNLVVGKSEMGWMKHYIDEIGNYSIHDTTLKYSSVPQNNLAIIHLTQQRCPTEVECPFQNHRILRFPF